MARYWFHGLVIECERPLVGLALAIDAPVDVVVREGALPERAGDTMLTTPFWRVGTDRAIRFTLPGVLSVMIADDQMIGIDVAAGVGSFDVETLLTGPIATALLHRRGVLPLRATTICVAGSTIALCGVGRSTMAAALGGEVVSDDTTAVRFVAGQPVVDGGAGLRLWPDALAALGRDATAWPPIRAGHAKRVDTEPPKTAPSRRIDAVVRLTRAPGDAAPKMRRLTGAEAMMPFDAIVQQWAIGVALERKAAMFQDAMRLAAAVPVHELAVPHDLARLDEVARALAAGIETA